MTEVLNSVVGAISETPLMRLDRLTRLAGVEGTILAKLEYLNPGFSKQDRAALGIIEEAERSGALQPGQTMVELSACGQKRGRRQRARFPV
jgi:cysteine synthase A